MAPAELAEAEIMWSTHSASAKRSPGTTTEKRLTPAAASYLGTVWGSPVAQLSAVTKCSRSSRWRSPTSGKARARPSNRAIRQRTLPTLPGSWVRSSRTPAQTGLAGSVMSTTATP